MSVYKVERKVDTVIVEMDISVAEQLAEVLFLIQDGTRRAKVYEGSPLLNLFQRLTDPDKSDHSKPNVRFPSPLYSATPRYDGVLLLDRI